MKNKSICIVIGSLIAVMTLLSCATSSHHTTATSQAADSAILELEQLGYKGSVLVAQGGDVIYHRDSGLSVTANCLPSYWIASISKQFTAVGILLLHERGVVDIRNSIAAYLPDVPPGKSEITLFQLLTHTSGLSQQYAADGINDRIDAQAALLASELKTKPGEQFSYANDNYNLLAMIIETSSGMAYEDFISKEVLLPAGMTHSGFWGMPVARGTCIPLIAVQLDEAATRANWGFRGATGMRASVRDLHVFMESLQRNDLLSDESKALLFDSHVTLSSGLQVGFNWFGRQTDQGYYVRFSRGQESFGGNAVIYDYPDQDLTNITATNAGPAESGDGPVEGWSRKTHKALAAIFITH